MTMKIIVENMFSVNVLLSTNTVVVIETIQLCNEFDDYVFDRNVIDSFLFAAQRFSALRAVFFQKRGESVHKSIGRTMCLTVYLSSIQIERV